MKDDVFHDVACRLSCCELYKSKQELCARNADVIFTAVPFFKNTEDTELAHTL